MTRVVVVGGGVGGMVAALRAKQHGGEVTLIEARHQLGGLASPLEIDGLVFDGGPYILLDRVRLGWALDQVGIELASVPMVDLDPAYEVHADDGGRVAIYRDLERTAASLNQLHRGSGNRYRTFVHKASVALELIAPLLSRPHGAQAFLSTGAWRAAPWAMLSLNQVLSRHRVTGPAADAVRIWSYIAGADPASAPGPMALVPALIHRDGAARPVGGIHRILATIETKVVESGIQVLRGAPVVSIDQAAGRVRGVTLEGGESVGADVVISDIGGAEALLGLVDVAPPRSIRARMAGPLQSPGVTGYMRTRGNPSAEIRFRVEGVPKSAYAVIHPKEPGNGVVPGRLISPMSHAQANDLGPDGQRTHLESLVAENWWRRDFDEVELVGTRLVEDWGSTFRLRDNAMNLSMARRQMLLGRLPHRIAHVPGLFLTGSWTHPGQWISFCSVSGVLSADAAFDKS